MVSACMSLLGLIGRGPWSIYSTTAELLLVLRGGPALFSPSTDSHWQLATEVGNLQDKVFPISLR